MRAIVAVFAGGRRLLHAVRVSGRLAALHAVHRAHADNRRVVSFGTMIARSMFLLRDGERLGLHVRPTARANRWSGSCRSRPAPLPRQAAARTSRPRAGLRRLRSPRSPLRRRDDRGPAYKDAEQLALHSFVLPFDDRLWTRSPWACARSKRISAASCSVSQLSRLLAVTFGRLFPFLVPAGARRWRLPGPDPRWRKAAPADPAGTVPSVARVRRRRILVAELLAPFVRQQQRAARDLDHRLRVIEMNLDQRKDGAQVELCT